MEVQTLVQKAWNKSFRVGFNALSKPFIFVFGLSRGSYWSARVVSLLEHSTVSIKDDRKYLFHVASPLMYWRVQTFFEKEPETVEWLRQMKPNDILFDVGANVGMYTIYAGVREVQVFAFEPESSNYYYLNRNIQANGISDRVTAYCLAVSSERALDALRLSAIESGAANHSFATDVDACGRNFAPLFRQGCLGMTLDQLVYEYGIPLPKFIKIDVDGLEAKIVDGATRLLRDPGLQGILIEMNEALPESQTINQKLTEASFQVSSKGNAVLEHRSGMPFRNYVYSR